ncbi:MAG: hypothetical protein II054_08070 [Treponema sp.]|nr:hypothetical protein [Treponema sp.]MEE3314722.1 hypothetical protein [Treponema sp.]
MKKLLLIMGLSFLALSTLTAEIDKPKRFFEVGMDFNASVSENLLGVTEVMQKDLVIDLPKIYSEMGRGGFKFNMAVQPSYFMNLYIDGWGIGTRTDISFSGGFGISKDFFKLLAEGNSLDEDMKIATSFNMQAFLSQSISVGLNLNGFKVKITPSYFLPLLYMPDPHIALNVRMNSDGQIKASADGVFSVYTLADLSESLNGKSVSMEELQDALTALNTDDLLEQVKSVLLLGAGIDLAASVQYPLLENLDIGAYTSLQIIPGTLHNKISSGFDFSAESENGIMDWYTSNDEDKGDNPFTTDGPNLTDIVAEKTEYKVSKPFRFGVEAAWRPIGNWFVLHPMLGVAMRNPIGSEGFSWERVYPEYRLSVDMTFLYVLGLSVSTEYMNQVFAHTLGLSLNTRVFELDASVGVSGADFFKSFTVRGLQANVGFRLGI